ncbi:MAG: hypothetical protein ACM3N1_00145 [Accumulibacter sp.]
MVGTPHGNFPGFNFAQMLAPEYQLFVLSTMPPSAIQYRSPFMVKVDRTFSGMTAFWARVELKPSISSVRTWSSFISNFCPKYVLWDSFIGFSGCAIQSKRGHSLLGAKWLIITTSFSFNL